MNATAQALTPRETARVLALEISQVQDLIRSGDLSAVDVHGRACPTAAAVRRLGEHLTARRRRVLAALERDLPRSARSVDTADAIH